MSGKRWFRFAFHEPGRADRDLPLHHLRDADAALFIAPVLSDKGFRYSGLILNVPSLPRRSPANGLISVDDSVPPLGPDDLLVLTTRPPLHDWDEGNRSQVDRSYNTLEDRVLKPLRRVFERCSRVHVKLSRDVAGESVLSAKYANVKFGDGQGAPLQRHQPLGHSKWSRPSDKQLTLFYLVYISALWPSGPQLLTAFGMGGLQTLVWGYRLGRDYGNHVTTREFLIAEAVQTVPPLAPLTMNFADEWAIHSSADPG